MTTLEVEAFLSIYKNRTISAAAEELFISQSSLSTRLRTLERETGSTLFIRGRGQRTLEPTEAGVRFARLAENYMEIVREMCSLGGHQYQKQLRVATFNSIGTYLMPPVYERFMRTCPDVFLKVQENDAGFERLLSKKNVADLVFSAHPIKAEDVFTNPVLSEPLWFICAAKASYPPHVTIDDISVENEIYIDWDRDFSEWHRKHFGDAYPRIGLEIMEQLHFFLRQRDHWSFVPASVASGFLVDPGVRRCKIDFYVPDRTVHFNCRMDMRNAPEIRAFLQCLREELASPERREIATYYPVWGSMEDADPAGHQTGLKE